MTNYEKIKQMSIDEMTIILEGLLNDLCDYCSYASCDECRNKSDIEIVRDWLESEAEE